MAIQKAARRGPSTGRSIGSSSSYAGVCRFWLAGKCNRNPCKFLHTESPLSNSYHHSMKFSNPKSISKPQRPKRVLGSLEPKSVSKRPVFRSVSTPQEPKKILKRQEPEKIIKPQEPEKIINPQEPEKILKPQQRVCEFWASGTCAKGEKCLFLHSWYQCKDFTLLGNLQGHKKGIVGIGLPSGSDKLYSGSKDGTVRVWDGHSGVCSRVVNMGQEVQSLVCEGSWVFIGLINVIKAWNIENSATFELKGSIGQVYAVTAFNDLLFAGGQCGDILVWRGSSDASSVPVVASLKGHTGAVTSLIIGANRLYSSSVDQTIKVWDIHNFVCLGTLKGHTEGVTSLVCWDQFLLSCSLDQTIKVWGAASDDGNLLEVAYTHTVDQGVLSLKGILDNQGTPVLFCAVNDNSLRVYDLPTFMERGKIFSRRQVSATGVAPGGLFFTGDGCGTLKVWKWSQQSPEQKQQGSSL